MAQTNVQVFSGNVGIGATNPATYLHLSAKNSDPLATEGDFIGTHTLTEYLRFTSIVDIGDVNSVSVGFKLGADDNSTTSPDGRLDICANKGTAGNDSGLIPNQTIATFLGSGNVGIGTTNPSSRLDVTQDFGGNGPGVPVAKIVANDGGIQFGVQIGEKTVSPFTRTSLRVVDDGQTVLMVDGYRKRVGIGKTDPSVLLDLYRDSTNGAQINFESSGGYKSSIGQKSSASSDRSLQFTSMGSYAGGNAVFNFLALDSGGSNYSHILTMTGNGNVGIGTTNPGARLEVYGGEGIRSRNADNTVAKLSAYGVLQGTGLLYVGQSNDFGGGIEYNGDNNPVSTGAGADFTALYRLSQSSFSWTARNFVQDNTWEFRNTIVNSDDRVKENETYIRGATDTLMKLKPQLYDKKPAIESTDTKEWFCEAGLIAQELYYDVPELRHLVKIPRDARNIDANVSITSTDPTEDPDYSAWGKDTSAVNYVGLVPYLIKAVQEITTELPRHKTPVSNITPQNVNDFVGLIVSKRGTVELSTKSEDKACYGVISEITCDTQNNEILVNSSGEGKIWVTNLTGNVEAGDLITTSNIAGYGQLQNSPVLSNFTVAKLTEDCDFNPSSTPVRRIRQEMSNVTVYSVSREVRVTEEEYNELAEEDRTTENRITYFDGDTQLTFDEYSNSESNTLRTETTLVFKFIHRHTSRTMREGYTPEVRQELVNVLDEHGQIQWEDTDETEKAYKIRYLDANGNITDEANHVYKAAFVGCTYHCG